MTDLVSPDEIETIVGTARHENLHMGRAVSSTETFYILHSKVCKETYDDLRDCPFSVYLDNKGVDEDTLIDTPGIVLFGQNGLKVVSIMRTESF